MLRLRRCLRGVSPDVAGEVEREIAAHIDDALAAHGASDEAAVAAVLERIGPPEEYARDWALYLMVDRGYRDWSVPHMVRSAAFWGFGTLAGGVAVLAFGALYATAVWSVYVGLGHVFGSVVRSMGDGEGNFGDASYLEGVKFLLLGLIGLVWVTLLVRGFIGQYVRRARPHAFGLEAGDGWAHRTSRRIVLVAAGGAALTAAVGLVDWVVWDAGGAPPGILLGVVAGVGLLVLAPVLGLLWSAWAEGP
jgi:hypothetical protein